MLPPQSLFFSKTQSELWLLNCSQLKKFTVLINLSKVLDNCESKIPVQIKNSVMKSKNWRGILLS